MVFSERAIKLIAFPILGSMYGIFTNIYYTIKINQM